MRNGNGWTEATRQRQATLIHQWQPWKQSTGPKTAEGKAKVARNGFKGGKRPLRRRIARLLKRLRQCLQTASEE